MNATEFRERVVVILAAGCAEGRDMARMAAAAGARVVVVDHDEVQVNTIARQFPDRIEPLRLDVFNPVQCRMFCDAWGAEPLDLLLHCQPLRAAHRLGAAAQGMPAMTEGLAKGLARGRGRVITLSRASDPAQEVGQQALTRALEALPALMQEAPWAKGLRVTGLRLPGMGDAPKGLRTAVRMLMARDLPVAPGVVLPLSADPIDAGRGGGKPTRDE